MTEEVKFEDAVFRSYPTGSRYICNPAPMDTDNDTVILVNGYFDWRTILLNDGWEDCGQYDQGGDFTAFRKGEENYIVTENEKFFDAYVKATEGAKALNLLVKEDRIKLFQSVMDAGEGYVGLNCRPKKFDNLLENLFARQFAVAANNEGQILF